MYKYGMKLRGYSMGTQPKGVEKWEDVDKEKTGYWSIIWYKEALTEEQIRAYELEYIRED